MQQVSTVLSGGAGTRLRPVSGQAVPIPSLEKASNFTSVSAEFRCSDVGRWPVVAQVHTAGARSDTVVIAEHWVVVHGVAMVQAWRPGAQTLPGQYQYIPLQEKHRLTNVEGGRTGADRRSV